jgi:hypothetical protein
MVIQKKRLIVFVASILVMTGSTAMVHSWDVSLDYNIKPRSERWMNLQLCGSFPWALPSNVFLNDLRFGISLDNGFYFPDFEENPGPTYRKPRSGETDADVRLTGMVSAFSLKADWLAFQGAIAGINVLRYYTGPGLFLTGPVYVETGIRLVSGAELVLFRFDGGDVRFFLEAAPRMGIELNSIWFVWDMELAAGFRVNIRASR